VLKCLSRCELRRKGRGRVGKVGRRSEDCDDEQSSSVRQAVHLPVLVFMFH